MTVEPRRPLGLLRVYTEYTVAHNSHVHFHAHAHACVCVVQKERACPFVEGAAPTGTVLLVTVIATCYCGCQYAEAVSIVTL